MGIYSQALGFYLPTKRESFLYIKRFKDGTLAELDMLLVASARLGNVTYEKSNLVKWLIGKYSDFCAHVDQSIFIMGAKVGNLDFLIFSFGKCSDALTINEDVLSSKQI
jgi:hypothetical protein